MSRKEINIRDIDKNLIKMLGDDWMLITAGNSDAFNTMTASWGGFGIMWGSDIATAVIRPQRYTDEFISKAPVFSLSFFGGDYKKELTVCGRTSGRDTDKVKETGLTPVFSDNTVYFDEAKIVLICEKIYVGKIDKNAFVDEALAQANYPQEDYHNVYVGKILKVLVKD